MRRTKVIIISICVVGLLIAFIGAKPRLLTMKETGLTTKALGRAMDSWWSRETDKESQQEKRPKYEAEFWHNHTTSVCKSLGMNTDVSTGEAALPGLVDDKHELIICPIAKVGSSYLGRVFAVLLGQDPAKDPKDVKGKFVYSRYMPRQPRLRWFSDDERLERIQNYYSAVVVREPFGRLLSAYRAKIEKPWSVWYAKKAREMRKHKDGNTTFTEFVAYLLKSAADRDPHWKPYYKACAPCKMDFDFVAKLETIDEDLKHIYEEVKVTDIIVPPPAGIQTADAYLQEYYKQVPKRYLRKLYEKYKPDFLIFNYSIPAVIKAMMS